MNLRTRSIVVAIALATISPAQNLEQEVTLTAPAAPLATVLSEISAKTGVKLMAGAAARDVVSVRVTSVPLNELMRRLAESTACEWAAESGGFRLLPDTGAQNVERTAELRARTADYKRAIEELFANFGQGPEMTAASARASIEKMRDETRSAMQEVRAGIGGGDGPGGGFVQRVASIGGDTPASRAIARLVRNLNAADFAAMTPGSRVVFTPAPTPMQKGLGAWKPVIAQLVREQHAYREAAEAAGDRDPMARMVARTGEGAGEPANAVLIASRQGFEDAITLQLTVSDAQGQLVAFGFTMLDGVGRQQEAGKPVAEAEPLKLSPDALEFAKLIAGRRAAGGPQSTEMVVVSIATGDGDEEPTMLTGSPDGPKNAMPATWNERLLHPEKYEPLGFLAGEVLVRMADSEDVDLVAVVPDSLLMRTASAFANGSLGSKETLRRLQADWGMQAARDGGWLVLRPSRPDTVRDQRVNRAALGSLLRSLATKGRWTLDEKAAYAASRPAGLGDPALDSELCEAVDPDGFERSLFNPFLGQTEALRFWGQLTLSQRQLLLNGRGIPLGSLSPALLTTAHRMVYLSMDGPRIEPADAASRGPGGRMPRMMGMGDPASERTYVLPSGVPRNGNLTVRVVRTPVALGITEQGRYAMAQSPRDIAVARTMQARMPDGREINLARTYPNYQMGERVSIRLEFALAPRVSLTRSLSEVNPLPGAQKSTFDQLPEAFRRQVEEESRRFGEGARGGIRIGAGGPGGERRDP